MTLHNIDYSKAVIYFVKCSETNKIYIGYGNQSNGKRVMVYYYNQDKIHSGKVEKDDVFGYAAANGITPSGNSIAVARTTKIFEIQTGPLRWAYVSDV